MGSGISAIVCVRDGARRIGRALASIRAQTIAVDEIVVVDGGSRDDTRAIAAACPGVRVVGQPGTGLAGARNAGIDQARGELVAFLDHDDEWTPDKIAVQRALIARLTAPAFVVAHLHFVDDDGAAPQMGAPPRLGRTPGTLLAHKATFDAVGGFDGTLGMGCDMEWFARAAASGLATATATETLLRKTLRADALSADRARNRAAAFAVIARRLKTHHDRGA
ncbi:MAG: glycosyltransferase family A protein [Alphaproteobacteria bacterium]